MLLVGPFVAAGHDAHASVFGGRVGEREPQREHVVGGEPVIGRILMPRHKLAVLRVLEPERRQIEQDVGTDQVLDGIENLRVMGDLFEPLEREMAFDADVFRDGGVDRRFVGFQFAAAFRSLFAAQPVDGKDVTVVPELVDLGLCEDFRHGGVPIPVNVVESTSCLFKNQTPGGASNAAGRSQDSGVGSSVTGLDRVPIPSISTSQKSPARM